MEAFQWEEREEQTPFWVHMIAGSLAGLSEHISMLPLDNVKTHCQAGSRLRFSQIVKNIYRTGGLSNFYSGTSILAMGCIPAHAIYFSIYEQAKKHMDCQGQSNHYKFALVGMASALFHDLVMTPTEVLKQRLQLSRSQQAWVHTKDLAISMFKNEGFISFYRSFGINFLMSMPFNSCMIFMNEKLKYLMEIKSGDKLYKYYLCGGLAGAFASIPTAPFDVIKTKLNTQDCLNRMCEKKIMCEMLSKKEKVVQKKKYIREPQFVNRAFNHQKKTIIKYRTIIDTTATIFRQDGLKGFFKGLKYRMMIQSSSSAIAWGTYNLFKNLIYPINAKF